METSLLFSAFRSFPRMSFSSLMKGTSTIRANASAIAKEIKRFPNSKHNNNCHDTSTEKVLKQKQ